jgi:hypothetical protein
MLRGFTRFAAVIVAGSNGRLVSQLASGRRGWPRPGTKLPFREEVFNAQGATIFITQNDSLGVAREAILRDLLVKHCAAGPDRIHRPVGNLTSFGLELQFPWIGRRPKVLT